MYENWEMKTSELDREEYSQVAQWCNSNGYKIVTKDGYYKVEKVVPTAPTHEEIRQMRANYRRTHIDDKTAERTRKQANRTWTEEDEQAYLQLDAEVTAWIEANLKYPEGEE